MTEADLSADRYPGAVLGSIVGKAGLERQYDDTLRGNEGVRYIEVNARGRLVREGAASASLPPTPGNPIITTIDLDLQRVHRQHLAGRRPRRDGSADAQGRGPGTLLGAHLRSQQVRRRHLFGGVAEAEQRSGPAAAQPGDSGSLSPRLAIQARHLRHGAETRPDPAEHADAGALPRRHATGQPGLPLLEEGGPRHPRSDRRGGRQLRRLLLPARPAARPGRHHPGRRASWGSGTRAASIWRTS